MARRKGRVKDKWREKQWVKAMAPDSFNNIELAYIPVTSNEGALGRVIEVTLFDILKGDPSQHNYKIYFQIDKVEEERATTIFKRFEYSKEFLRSLVRRGSSKINFTLDVKTSDGYVFRVKLIVLTQRQLNTSRQHALRLLARDVINKIVPEMTVEQFVQATCYSKINSDITASFKKVIKARHVGLEKVKLIRTAEKETILLEA
ncbi:MAG: 30S ribosomal protein S3ae [Nitrosopumilus sp. B06]|nr:MAG: 30S ribosomal protein S3ae [Nitrosopumilus sp. D6]RNJ80580.1 MAG: 30S ribosomal protein S3ae [Nitrosopumilus sp. B06]